MIQECLPCIFVVVTYFVCSGSVLEVWQGYIAMETEMGNINEVRSLFKRCYSKRFPGTGSEVCGCHELLISCSHILLPI